MKNIPLTQGKYALVDNEDFDYLSQFKWSYDAQNHAAVRGLWNKETKKTTVIGMHRFLMQTPKGMDTDHINGDRLDNRRGNLRICTHAENLKNAGMHKNNTSGYKGVSWDKSSKRWVSRINDGNGNYPVIGYFVEKIQAAIAYDKAALLYHGKFARTNNYKETI